MFPCVCVCASGSSQTKLSVHLLGGFGRRLTVCNCVFTQNRAALAGQGMGAYTHMHAIAFYTTSQTSARLHAPTHQCGSRSPSFSSRRFILLGKPRHSPSTSHSLFTSLQQRFSRRPYSSLLSSQHFFGVLRVRRFRNHDSPPRPVPPPSNEGRKVG